MNDQLKTIIEQYDPNLALDYASTIPSSWYIDKDFYDHELQTVFSQSWQLAAHGRQLTEPGKYVTTDIAGEPVVIVRGLERHVTEEDGPGAAALIRERSEDLFS